MPNGCPERLFDKAGQVVWAARYNGWGLIEDFYVQEVDQPLRLQGQFFDEETGNCYNRYRYYDPRIGAFLSADPLGLAAGENLYAFAPSVHRYVDPLGLCKKVSKGLNVPERVQSRINLRNGSIQEGAGFEHVLDRHFNTSKNTSQFTISPDELKTILQSKEVVSTPVTKVLESSNGLRYLRKVNFKKTIGLDKFNNFQPTNIMTVLTDKFGNLVTATPGVIK